MTKKHFEAIAAALSLEAAHFRTQNGFDPDATTSRWKRSPPRWPTRSSGSIRISTKAGFSKLAVLNSDVSRSAMLVFSPTR